jgi:hypothetical protein
MKNKFFIIFTIFLILLFISGPWIIKSLRATPILEPATMLLLGTALIIIAGIGRKKIF